MAGINNENFVLLLRKNLVVSLNLEENILSFLNVEGANLKTLVVELIKTLNSTFDISRAFYIKTDCGHIFER